MIALALAFGALSSGGGGCDYDFQCNSGANLANSCTYSSCVCSAQWNGNKCESPATTPKHITVVMSALKVTKKMHKNKRSSEERSSRAQQKWQVKKVNGVSFMLPTGTPAARLSPLGKSKAQHRGVGVRSGVIMAKDIKANSTDRQTPVISSMNSIWSNLFKDPHVSKAAALTAKRSNSPKHDEQPEHSLMPSLQGKRMRVDAAWSSLTSKDKGTDDTMADVVNDQILHKRMAEARLRERAARPRSASTRAQSHEPTAGFTPAAVEGGSTVASTWFDKLYSSRTLPASGGSG
jgi:hypothetical protein